MHSISNSNKFKIITGHRVLSVANIVQTSDLDFLCIFDCVSEMIMNMNELYSIYKLNKLFLKLISFKTTD